jgi:hypothetical protein
MNTLHAVPAYGRKYETAEALINDWLDGKDFRAVGGSYFSIRDYALLSETYNYDDICIAFDTSGVSSVQYVPLFAVA